MQSVTDAGAPYLYVTETWSLSEDGKTLAVNREVVQANNGMKYTIKAYYDKE